MEREAIKRVKVLLLDFDGVFYPFTTDFHAHVNQAAARAALRLGVPLSPEDALILAERSYAALGSSVEAFQKLYDLPVQDCHGTFSEELNPTVVEALHVTAEHLMMCPVEKAILSHGSRAWIRGVLDRFGLNDLFPDSHVFGLEDLDFRFKQQEDGAVYRHVLDRLGTTAEGTVMVEDTLCNLPPAKGLGLTTVYITQGRPFEPAKHPYVDHTFVDLATFFDATFEPLAR